MVEKVTLMEIKVDLQCCRCYKKIKKVLCKFREIRDTIYDEKNNKVKISVVCSNPEKLMQKISCKGGKCIKCIKIIPPPPPPPPPEKTPEKPPKPQPPPPPPPLQVDCRIRVCCQGCYEGCGCSKQAPGWCGCGCHRPGRMPGGWCGCGCRRDYYPSPCYYICEENPSACTIM